MAKSDMDAAISSESNNSRSAEGRGGTAFSAPSAKPASGKVMPKGNRQAGDPTAAGTKVNRQGRPMSASERNGAGHTIVTSIVKQNDPAAGATLANAPIVPPVMKRGGFESGISSAY